MTRHDIEASALPPPPRSGRGRRALVWLGIAVAVGTVAVPIGVAGWGAWEARTLARRVAALRAAGEPVTPADLAAPAVPDAANAAAAWRAGARAIDDESAAWTAHEDLQSLSVADELRLPLWAKEREVFRAALAENAAALPLAERAARLRRADWRIEFSSPMIGTLLPDLNEQRNLAELLRDDGLLALEGGDVPRALRRVDELLSQSHALDQHPGLIAHLVAVGIAHVAADLAAEAARDVAAAGGPPPPAALREQADALVGRLLGERELHEGLIRAYQSERVMQLDALAAVADGTFSIDGMTRGEGERQKSAVRGPPRGWVLRNAVGALDHMARLLAAAEGAPDLPAFRARLTAAGPSAVERSPKVYMIASILVPALDRVAYQQFRVLAHRRTAATALALALYAADHDGRLPETLDELVPGYVPAVPRDPMAGGGKPLGYVPDPGRPRVYNVGQNGVDDGGRPADPEAPRPENNRLSDDVVDLKRQPRPEPAPEAEPDHAEPPEFLKNPEKSAGPSGEAGEPTAPR